MAISVLRFDLRAPARFATKHAELYAAALDLARFADERGFDSISLSEHHGVDDGFLPSPLLVAAAMASRTQSVHFGISALLAPLYDPVKLAEDLAVLDLLSRGRVSTTLGMGYRPDEYAMFGRRFEERGKLLDEWLEVLLRAWRGERFTWQGRTVQVTPAPFTRPHPPIFVGGQSRRGALRAARFGLGYQPASNDPEMERVYLAACEERGVTPQLRPPGTGEMIWVSRDPDRTWRQIGEHLLYEARVYSGWQPATQQSSTVHSRAKTVDELRREGLYRVLTPEQCLERARAQGPWAAFVLYPLCGGIPPELAFESVRLYADEVLAKLRG
jgi:alkanesulfonate monooxygenase SsuD/methylene tetrahydromethanopterin reductase-like flavin-dependent oxidoreductase (luciferase family)